MNQTLFRQRIILLLCLISVCIPVLSQKTDPAKGLKSITTTKLKTHIDYLASDALLGRNTPSPGLDSAAVYIAGEYKKYGVEPVQGTYYHPVPLTITSLGKDNSVEIISEEVARSLKIKTEFVPYEITATGEANGSLVFAGYGITAPEYTYDDYAGVDVKGKIVVVMRHEPGENDSTSVFDGVQSSKYGFLEYKAENAINHGAVGMIVLTDPLNHQLINPRGFPWPSLSRIIPKDALPMQLKDNSEKKIPVVHAGKEVMELLFGSVDSLKNLQFAIDKAVKPISREFPAIRAKIRTSTEENAIKTNNVIGIIPGTDPDLRNEYLVIGAHYDHVGFNKEYLDGEDYINNGADDNASGTAGILAVAEAFSKMKSKPKRSVIFMAFSGEEKGLFGSEAYVRNPLFPLEQTVAMLNLDMISRNHIDTLYLEGASASPDLTDIVKKENSGIGFTIIMDDELEGRSDHASFYKKKVPFVFYFAGLHPDYHTVRDNPDSIDPAKAARISQLVFKTAWHVANDNKKYQLIEKKK